jgi:hypothetical protein
VPGGYNNTADGYSAFAAGYRAKALHGGSFVWADQIEADFASSAVNQFNLRCTGGARIVTAIDAASNPTAGVRLPSGSTSWSTISDRYAKKNFHPVDTKAVLTKLAQIPVTSWNYQWEDTNATPHLGPMAQDFKAAFYPGCDDKTITTLEFDGVALASIQGLNQKLEEELQQKTTEIAELKKAVMDLTERVNQLAAQQNGGAR